ncbi:Ankyrin repeat protein [Mycena venus]|uniref:Ankyrin repeat protein n=1 Tax=Mycena venus TaxID=2733690 RepID=A0A8H6WXM8_9AGAR|nr:Ankyrin repeat protein [Mycena venus]
MADIIGIVSGALAFLETASTILGCLIDAYNAPKEQRELLVEMSSLRPMLLELEKRAQANPSSPVLTQMTEPLEVFRSRVGKLAGKLSKGQKLPWQKRLAWSWIKKETRTYLGDVERIKSSISIWLNLYARYEAGWVRRSAVSAPAKLHVQLTLLASDVVRHGHDNIQSQIAKANDQQQQRAEAATYEQVMKWTTSLNFFQRQQLIFETQQTRTGQWLLTDSRFQDWLSSFGGILWCRGIPGAGKTVLTAMVVHHLRVEVQAQTNNIGVACIYLDHKETEAQSVQALLASLWKQLVVGRSIPDAVYKLHKHHSERDTRPSLHEVNEIFRSAIAEYSRTYLVVDALDEYPEPQRDILFEYLSTAMEGAPVNLLLTSRPHITLDPFFPTAKSLEIRADKRDLHEFVDEYIRKSRYLSKHVRAHPELREQIQIKIVNDSDGMFLAPKLHLNFLNEMKTVKSLRDALQQSPKGLKNLYDEAMERIENDENKENRKLARLALIWVANTKRLLSAGELREALAIEPRAKFLNPENILDIADIIAVCAGLIIEETPHIRLVHPTTQEYLDSIQESRFPDAQAHIATACFTYLSFDCFSSLHLLSGAETEGAPVFRDDTDVELVYSNRHRKLVKNLFPSNPFLGYTQYCLIHAAGEPELLLYDEIVGFLEQAPKLLSLIESHRPLPWNYPFWPDQPSPQWISAASNLTQVFMQLRAEKTFPGDSDKCADDHNSDMLFVAAYYGHLNMVRLLVDNLGVNVDARHHRYGGSTPLYVASENGHEAVVKFLLDHDAQPNIVGGFLGGTPLQAAAYEGHISVIDALCRHGADVTVGGWLGTALQRATLQGNITVVQTLIRCGAEVNQLDVDPENKYGIALHAAAHAGRIEVVRLLIENGANVDLQGGVYGTALHAAWNGQNEDIFRFLLQKGANANSIGPAGTILQAVILTVKEHLLLPLVEEMIGLLIEKGANVNMAIRGETPLGSVSFLGHERMVQILIDHGADVNFEWIDNHGRSYTALGHAASRGHAPCVKLLLENGAKANFQHSSTGTALHAACLQGHEDVARILVEVGHAEVNLAGGWYEYPLHAAVYSSYQGRPTLVKFLLEHGADVNAEGPTCGTALQAALKRGQTEVIQLLLDHGAVAPNDKSGGNNVKN